MANVKIFGNTPMIICLVAAWIFKSAVEILQNVRAQEELVRPRSILLVDIEPADDHCRPLEVCKTILRNQVSMASREKALEVRTTLAESLIRRFKRPSETNVPEVEWVGCPENLSNRWPHSPIRKEGFMELYLLVHTSNQYQPTKSAVETYDDNSMLAILEKFGPVSPNHHVVSF